MRSTDVTYSSFHCEGWHLAVTSPWRQPRDTCTTPRLLSWVHDNLVPINDCIKCSDTCHACCTLEIALVMPVRDQGPQYIILTDLFYINMLLYKMILSLLVQNVPNTNNVIVIKKIYSISKIAVKVRGNPFATERKSPLVTERESPLATKTKSPLATEGENTLATEVESPLAGRG